MPADLAMKENIFVDNFRKYAKSSPNRNTWCTEDFLRPVILRKSSSHRVQRLESLRGVTVALFPPFQPSL